MDAREVDSLDDRGLRVSLILRSVPFRCTAPLKRKNMDFRHCSTARRGEEINRGTRLREGKILHSTYDWNADYFYATDKTRIDDRGFSHYMPARCIIRRDISRRFSDREMFDMTPGNIATACLEVPTGRDEAFQ